MGVSSKLRPYLRKNETIQQRLQWIVGSIFAILVVSLIWEDLREVLS